MRYPTVYRPSTGHPHRIDRPVRSPAELGNKVGRKAVAWGAILGTLPDLDVFLPYGGSVEAFTYHRGFSHSLFVGEEAAGEPAAWKASERDWIVQAKQILLGGIAGALTGAVFPAKGKPPRAEGALPS